MTFEITTYSGGTMVKDGYNFVNEGGSQQFRQTYSYNVNTKKVHLIIKINILELVQFILTKIVNK